MNIYNNKKHIYNPKFGSFKQVFKFELCEWKNMIDKRDTTYKKWSKINHFIYSKYNYYNQSPH